MYVTKSEYFLVLWKHSLFGNSKKYCKYFIVLEKQVLLMVNC